MNLTWPAIPLLAAFVSACASTSPRPAFQDTGSLVERRIGHRLVWNQGTTEDDAVGMKVHNLVLHELTADAAIQIALVNNKILQATYEDLTVAQADLVQAGLLQNPVFGAGVTFPIAGSAQTGFGLSVSQDFLSVFLLAARKRVAEAELRATERRVADAVLRMANEVEVAFYGLNAAQQVAAMRRSILEAGDAGLDLAQRQHAAGNIADLDLANEQGLYEQVRTDLLRSDAEVMTAREVLTRLLGLWGPDASYRVVAKLPELPPEEVALDHLESLAVSRRLDLGAAHEEAQAISHALAMSKNFRWLGATSVGAGIERAPEGFTVAGPNVGVELPVFDQKRAVVARLEGQLRAALARETALAVDVRSEVRTARGRVVATRAVVERYAKVVVPLRQRIVALTLERYDAMLVGTYQLLQAKQSEVTAYREFIEALRDYWIARADLERATGGTLPPASPLAAATSPRSGSSP
jgi:cobalt-zinc-cadmium efflux system outer membrane protein